MAGNSERTFIMVKPDGVQRGLVGDIIKRFEQRGFKLVAMKFYASVQRARKATLHRSQEQTVLRRTLRLHVLRPSCPDGLEGKNAAKAGRMMMGETNPQASLPGSI